LWVLLSALIGAGCGIAYGVWLGSASTATATIFLAHDPALDETTAMATDDQLVHAGPVAQLVIDRLGLSVSAEDLQAEIRTEILTPQLLSLSVVATDPDTAIRQAGAVAQAFLDFRSTQLVTQADSVSDQLRTQVDSLQSEVAVLTSRYHRLSAGTELDQSTASDVLDERGRRLTQISDLETQIEEISVNADAVVAASRVVDPPRVRTTGPLRQFALPAASGWIGGLALATGLITTLCILSAAVRTRSQVAAALGVPVWYAFGPVRGLDPFAARARRRNRALAAASLRELGFGRPGTVSLLATVDATREADKIMATFVREHSRGQAEGGPPLELVDLSERGVLSRRRWRRRNHRSEGGLRLVRPAGPVQFARPVAAIGSRGSDGADERARIVVADVDPGIGVMALADWSDTASLLVVSGRTTFERLQATAEAFDTLGPRLELALMVNADARQAGSLGGLPAARDDDDDD
jgi:hypothetical protein